MGHLHEKGMHAPVKGGMGQAAHTGLPGPRPGLGITLNHRASVCFSKDTLNPTPEANMAGISL